MKVLNKRNLIFVILSIAILIACVLPVILNENAVISFNSLPAIVFDVCSFVYAIIAFLNKEHVKTVIDNLSLGVTVEIISAE